MTKTDTAAQVTWENLNQKTRDSCGSNTSGPPDAAGRAQYVGECEVMMMGRLGRCMLFLLSNIDCGLIILSDQSLITHV